MNVEEMEKRMKEWLEKSETEKRLWRTAYKIVAKNFYVDMDPRQQYSAKPRPVEASPGEDGTQPEGEEAETEGVIELEIKQRKPLFKVQVFVRGGSPLGGAYGVWAPGGVWCGPP